LKIQEVCYAKCLGCRSLKDILYGIADMEMIELNLQIYGQIQIIGFQGLYVIMGIRIVIIHLPQEVLRQVLKGERILMIEV
jgi:hypothetical protein